MSPFNVADQWAVRGSCHPPKWERSSEKEQAPNPGCPQISLPPPPLPHHQMLKSLEDKREPGILMPPPTICLLLKSQFSNFQPTTILQIPRSASVTFKALRDLAPIYFSCRDPALVMVIPALQHTPLCAGPLTPLTHSHTSAHLLAGNDSSRLR